MKTATLAIIVQNGKVLLGHKKRGEIGIGTLNGPGGKMEPEDLEDPVRCVIRETHEETGGVVSLRSEDLKRIGLITFYAGGMPDFAVHLFYAETRMLPEAIPETDDMTFGWYDISALPTEQMLESDREWFSAVAHGKTVHANVYYEERAKGFQGIEYLAVA